MTLCLLHLSTKIKVMLFTPKACFNIHWLQTVVSSNKETTYNFNIPFVHYSLLHRTHQSTSQRFDPSGLKTSILDVLMHTTTYTVNKDIAMNF